MFLLVRVPLAENLCTFLGGSSRGSSRSTSRLPRRYVDGARHVTDLLSSRRAERESLVKGKGKVPSGCVLV